MRKIQPDDTLREVMPDLADPETYLRNVIGTMRRAFREDPNAIVRIGTSGTGAYPYHLISWTDPSGDLRYSSCDGSKPDLNDRIRPESPDWSTRGIVYPEVEELLRSVIDRKSKRPI